MSNSRPRIAIVGGGPSGLTVGLLLHKRNIPFKIFELRSRPTEYELESPAGMLDLHEESGLAALRACGLLDEFSRHTDVCAETQIVVNKEGEVVHADEGGIEYRPEISRNSLTKILLAELPPETIEWEHKLVSTRHLATSSATTEVELDFGSKGKHTFDFVIGADGTWSRVRTLLTDTKPKYAGVQNITLNIREVTKRCPELSKFIGVGSFMALGDKHGIMTQRALQDTARIYVFISTPDENFGASTGLAHGTASDAKAKLVGDDRLLGRFGAKLKELVQTACDREALDHPGALLEVMPLYALPIGHSWEHRPGVTVIGDASHVMCPWGGEGVNLAMWDSLDVANAVIEAYEVAPDDTKTFQKELDPLIKEFEVGMAERAKEMAQGTYDNGQIMFGSDDGATAMAEWFQTMIAAAMAEAEKAQASTE